MKQIKESVQVKIKRSQINFAPYNPKRHTEEAVKIQRKNFQRVGYLGGIVWNRTTGNIVSGHKRVMAMDIEYKYDGTPETDYGIRVEAVEMDIKTEKEQNVFMDAKATNTRQDYGLLSLILPDMDYADAGITPAEYESIMALNVDAGVFEIPALTVEDLAPLPKNTKEEIREAKTRQREIAQAHHADMEAYITLSFSNAGAKNAFCEIFGYNPDTTKYIKGEELLKMME